MKMYKLLVLLPLLTTGCSSINVGTFIPVPGPLKPHLGLTFTDTGVKGHAGVSAGAGPVRVGVGGSSEELKYEDSSTEKK